MGDGHAGTEVRARLVEEPSDLAELRKELNSVSGRLTSARRGVGDEILLRIKPHGDTNPGDWRVGSQASDWILASPSSVLDGAHALPEAVDAALAKLEGAEVDRLEVMPTLALVAVLSDGCWLEIQGHIHDPNERDDDPPYWEVLSPNDELLRAGPGPIWVRMVSPVQQTAEAGRVPLGQLTVEELLALWSGTTAELRRRGVVRSPGSALGDVAEELVRKYFRGFRGSWDQAGWDVLSETGERLEVKAVRRRAGSNRLPTLVLHESDFDAIVAVVFDDALEVHEAWYLPRAAVLAHATGAGNRDRRRRLPLRRALTDASVIRLDLS